RAVVAGPGSAGGARAGAAAVSALSSSAPAASVWRRAVSRLSDTPANKANRRGSWVNGTQVPRWTSHSWSTGVRWPGGKPNSSSRGEKPAPAVGAGAVLPGQAHNLIVVAV